MGLWKDVVKIVVMAVTISMGTFLITLVVKDWIIKLLSQFPSEYSNYASITLGIILISIGVILARKVMKVKV